eukprot:scaffold298526_cov70-Cyclotella_meneghiniana.AAC.1
MLKLDQFGANQLHIACDFLTKNLVEVTGFLISACPESVRVASYNKMLPIHLLLGCPSLSKSIQKAMSLVLEEFPGSFDIGCGSDSNKPINERFSGNISIVY